MPSKSKAKGSSFEREVAAFLSSLYSASFVRVPNSGAYIGRSNSHRKNILDANQTKSFKGDIIAPDDWVNFNSECKSYATFPFHLLLSGDCKVVESWLDQLMEVSDPDNLNILMFKINRKGRFVAVQTKYTWVTDNFILYTSAKHGDWVFIEFDNFFKLNKDLLKAYSGSSTNNSSGSPDTTSDNIISIQI
jgi:hypothetical protein